MREDALAVARRQIESLQAFAKKPSHSAARAPS